MRAGRWSRTTGAAVMIAAVAACGDPETTDNRGYTKAPLEDPSILISGERGSAMSEYGGPNRQVVEELRLSEEVPGAATEGPELAAADLPQGVTQEMVTAGETVFGGAGMCFACHGANGTGGPLAPALNDAEWLHIDGGYEELVEIITAGVQNPAQFAAPMPPRGGAPLTDEQVREVAAYVFAISR